MSKEVDEIEEKSKENNTSSDYIEEKLDKNYNMISNERKDKKIYVPKIKMSESKIYRGSQMVNQRLSCQPNLSFKQRHDSNYSIRPTRTRKKTTADYYRNNYKENLLSSLIPVKSSSLGSSIKIKNEEEKKYENNDLKNYKYIEDENKGGYIKKLRRKSNIYEREKNNIKRKNNYIKKKQEQQMKDIDEKLKGPTINKKSQDIIEKNSEYIPIEIRAVALHSKNLFESVINENKRRNEKLKEENKEYEIIKQYKNKKSFNKNEWEDFIKNQESWNKEKKYKAKAAELFRNNIEQKVHYIPEIDKKSQLIIDDKRKKTIYVDDIYTRLYNDFSDLQERKKLRMCNSMPSFKPLLNKNFKKNIFNMKKTYNNSTNKTNKQIELYIKQKFKSKKIISHNPTKFTSKSFSNNSGFKTTNTNFVFNSKLLKNNYSYLKNKKSRYDENYFEEPIYISNNYENKNNKSNNLTNKTISHNRNNINLKNYINNNKNNTFYSYINDKNCEIKGSFFINKNNNSCIYSKVIKK